VAMMAAAAEDSIGGQRRWRRATTGAQDWVVDYIREGMTVASNARDSGVAMMAATVEDGNSRRQW
jgi:hypothetical protein